MPNFSGLWTARQQLQARGLSIWPARPGAPTSVTATGGNTSASVAFTAPANAGYPAVITGYTVTSSPGGLTGTGASSPITVSGLSNGTAYTFTVTATNATGTGPASAASNSVTPLPPQQIEYTTAGTYTFVAPAGLNPSTVSVVCVGGAGTSSWDSSYGFASGGGGLGYRNNYSVTSGSSYTVVVGPGTNNRFASASSRDSYFVNTSVCAGFGGQSGDTSYGQSGIGGSYAGTGGGNGGNGGSQVPNAWASGGGAGGYAGTGGNGGSGSGNGTAGSGGGGGGGSGGFQGGGGVGIYGQGTSGAAGGFGGSGGAPADSTSGGAYGGGGAISGSGSNGAVRIIWSTLGTTRTFPSTNTGNL